jgi:hypothetical protein
MDSILKKAIEDVQKSEIAFTKFITANDAGATGAHQAGFHIHKSAWRLFFDSEGSKGENKDKFITIRWQGDFETNSRFIYYGVGTRDEYRLTRFGRGFPYLQDENIGDLLVIIKKSSDYYDAYVLHNDEDIDEFLAGLNISTTDINGIVPRQFEAPEDSMLNCFLSFLNALNTDFPATSVIAANARRCYSSAYGKTPESIKSNPDKEILGWLSAEFQLFKTIENKRYSERIKTPFKTVEELVETANTILNRRKSRAGRSLEHHLEEIFKTFELAYDTQAVTEGNKKPDFLFPGAEAYLDKGFNEKKLMFLAAKTTCKDRWRQILNEADRIKTKHLFTLQQGISKNQLEEMYRYAVCLVVPKPYLTSFPQEFRERILTLDKFILQVKYTQA